MANDIEKELEGVPEDMLAKRREWMGMYGLVAALKPRAEPPLRIANEMRNRARQLRSQCGARVNHKLELEVLGELDLIGARAAELEAQRRSGALGKAQVAAAMSELDASIFAVRGRFQALMARHGFSYRPEASARAPGARQRELDAIEDFLARKSRREAA